MTPEDRSSRLQEAKTAVHNGRSAHAHQLLRALVQADPTDFTAWLWLISVAPDGRSARAYWQQAARLRPNDPRLPKAQAWLAQKFGTAVPAPPSSPPSPPPAATRRALWPLAAVAILLIAGLLAGVIWLAYPLLTTAQTAPTAAAVALVPTHMQTATAVASPTPAIPTATTTPTPPPTNHLAKAIAATSEPRPTWTTTPTPSATPSPTPTPLPTFVGSTNAYQRPPGVAAWERWINVDLGTQTLTAYEGDTAVFSTRISSGLPGHPTVTGQFRIWHRTTSQTMDGARLGYDYYLENVPFVQYFFEDYAIHGAYWHNNFGQPMSHGCVNVSPGDAEWLFDFASMGTVVNVHN